MTTQTQTVTLQGVKYKIVHTIEDSTTPGMKTHSFRYQKVTNPRNGMIGEPSKEHGQYVPAPIKAPAFAPPISPTPATEPVQIPAQPVTVPVTTP